MSWILVNHKNGMVIWHGVCCMLYVYMQNIKEKANAYTFTFSVTYCLVKRLPLLSCWKRKIYLFMILFDIFHRFSYVFPVNTLENDYSTWMYSFIFCSFVPFLFFIRWTTTKNTKVLLFSCSTKACIFCFLLFTRYFFIFVYDFR